MIYMCVCVCAPRPHANELALYSMCDAAGRALVPLPRSRAALLRIAKDANLREMYLC